jgi:hypothetical protein
MYLAEPFGQAADSVLHGHVAHANRRPKILVNFGNQPLSKANVRSCEASFSRWNWRLFTAIESGVTINLVSSTSGFDAVTIVNPMNETHE